MGALKELNPDQVNVSAFGISVDGFADGEFLRIEMNANQYETVRGTDGQITRSRNLDRSATVTLILMASSEANAGLGVVAEADRLASNTGVFQVEDLNGTALYFAEQAWIEKVPDVSYDRTATSREWVIQCADLVRTDAGT